jgi:hypothetical protein
LTRSIAFFIPVLHYHQQGKELREDNLEEEEINADAYSSDQEEYQDYEYEEEPDETKEPVEKPRGQELLMPHGQSITSDEQVKREAKKQKLTGEKEQ